MHNFITEANLVAPFNKWIVKNEMKAGIDAVVE